MKKVMLLAILTLFIISLIPIVSAEKKGGMPLLAMAELDEGVYKGSIADLSLEIQPGSGRVFVNTFPISKLDTQISMRFAKQVACKHAKSDCSKSDFIYTIKASSGIVGGPSAGAAAAVLTASLLENLEIYRDMAITGTINSGEVIGPVGGVNEKIDAASRAGIIKVLIPKWGIENGNETENKTSPIDKGKELGVEIVEVTTLGEALYHFTGKKETKEKKELSVDPEYRKIMKSLAVMLCNRTAKLENSYLEATNTEFAKNSLSPNSSILNFEKSAINQTEKANEAFDSGDYYTSASFCFRANINFAYLWLYFQDYSSEEIEQLAEMLEQKIDEFEEDIDKKELKTLTDLQAYMITKERIDESNEKIGLVHEKINSTKDAAYWVAFAQERLISARSWSKFFSAEGQVFRLDEESLKESCETKISEAEERYQYVNFYFGSVLSATREDINNAKREMREKDYVMCLYKASLAKSQANTIMSLIGIDDSVTQEVLSQKLEIAEQTIVEQQDMGIFPIMGYSYFEYANSLAESEFSSAMIYAEYALELSNFDFYFEKEAVFDFSQINYKLVFVLILGLFVGFLLGSRMKKPKIKKANSKKRKKR